MPRDEAGPRIVLAPAAVGRRAGLFVVLALGLSWVPLGVLAATTRDPAADGLSGLLFLAGGLGPGLAALLTVRVTDGQGSVRPFLAGLVRWRMGRWAFVLLAPLPVALAAVGLAAVTGPAGFDSAGLASWYLLPALLLSGVVFGGLEEVGWRGYLQPVLQSRMSALMASLAVGVVWAVWHAPLFWLASTTQAEASLWWFALGAVGLSVVFAWVYNSSAGNLLLLVLLHAAVNGWYSAAVEGLAPGVRGAGFEAYVALLTVLIAVGLVVRYGAQDLSRRRRVVWQAGV